MQLHDLRPAEGSTQKRKRVGRGTGSGKGKTSTRGTKGQKARTGAHIHAAFEGGQNRMTKRLPKLRGFNNKFKVEYAAVNLDALERLFEASSEVNAETLIEATGRLMWSWLAARSASRCTSRPIASAKRPRRRLRQPAVPSRSSRMR